MILNMDMVGYLFGLSIVDQPTCYHNHPTSTTLTEVRLQWRCAIHAAVAMERAPELCGHGHGHGKCVRMCIHKPYFMVCSWFIPLE
jgi:hypothetical protein